MNTAYSKKCPHCGKDFHARRLNQAYCTYFCKVRFNNERARLRRLSLLEVEKTHLTLNRDFSPKEIEKQESPITINHNNPVLETKKTPPFNWKIRMLIGAGFFGVVAILYSIYRCLNLKSYEVTTPNLSVQNQLAISADQIKINGKSPSESPISTDIFLKKMTQSSIPTNQPPKNRNENFGENIFHNAEKEHPDVIANKIILRKNNII